MKHGKIIWSTDIGWKILCFYTYIYLVLDIVYKKHISSARIQEGYRIQWNKPNSWKLEQDMFRTYGNQFSTSFPPVFLWTYATSFLPVFHQFSTSLTIHEPPVFHQYSTGLIWTASFPHIYLVSYPRDLPQISTSKTGIYLVDKTCVSSTSFRRG